MLINSERRYSGRVYIMDSDAVTLASANATKSALGTAKFINGFYNPVGSGYNARILRAVIATTSGTPGGPYFYNFLTGYVPNNTVTGTIRSFSPLQTMPSAMTAEIGVTLTTAASDTTALIQLATIGGPAAIAAGVGLYGVVDDPIVPFTVIPGMMFGLMCAAAGTSHVVQTTLFWEEVQF